MEFMSTEEFQVFIVFVAFVLFHTVLETSLKSMRIRALQPTFQIKVIQRNMNVCTYFI